MRREINEDKSWSTNLDLRYGFSNKKAGARGSFTYHNDPIHKQNWIIAGGVFPVQVDEQRPISEIVNAVYTLVTHQNFMKIYEKRFADFKHRREWFNGFDLSSEIAYIDRLPLENTTNYSFDWIGEHQFTPNNYFNNPHADTLIRTQAFEFTFRSKITIGQKYITRPHERIASRSKFPSIYVVYRKAIDVIGSDVNFDMLQLGMDYQFDLGLGGISQFAAEAGKFLNNHKTTIIDFKHFQVDQTIIGSNYGNGFQLLPYYSYSTNESWVEGHLEHHFGGFILNKIPLIKKLGLQELGGAHLLLTPDITYFEFNVGIEHLFKFIRIDYVRSFNDAGQPSQGVLVGLSFKGNISIE